MAQEPKPTGGSPPSYSLTDEQFAALLGSRGVLTDVQLERVVDALRHQHDFLGSLRRLTPEQQAVIDAVNVVGDRMAIENFVKAATLVPRHGNVVVLSMPPRTQAIRIFHTRGVVETSVQAGSPYVTLPAGIGPRDRIGRIEFLGPHGAVLGATGGERRASADECAQIDAVVPQKRSE